MNAFLFLFKAIQRKIKKIHSTLVLRVFGATYYCGCIIDMSKSRPGVGKEVCHRAKNKFRTRWQARTVK